MLVAAAVLQLVGAGLFVLAGALEIVFGLTHPRMTAMPPLGVATVVVGVAYVVVSIALLRRRRWAWVASLALDSLCAFSLIGLPLVGRVGFGELIILGALIGVPLFVTIGLLIGGRHAVPGAKPKTAAEPIVVRPPSGA